MNAGRTALHEPQFTPSADVALSGCKYSHYQLRNHLTGEILEYKHRSVNCVTDCRRRWSWYWAHRIATGEPERLLTLTNAPEDKERRWLAWNHFLQEVRRWERERGLMLRSEYVRVLERGQLHGMLHLHVGLTGNFLPQKLLKRWAKACGFGGITDIRKVKGEGAPYYMAKYFTKGGTAMPRDVRLVSVSRGWAKPEPFETTPGWELIDSRTGRAVRSGAVPVVDWERFGNV